jgi:hypothetical protein
MGVKIWIQPAGAYAPAAAEACARQQCAKQLKPCLAVDADQPHHCILYLSVARCAVLYGAVRCFVPQEEWPLLIIVPASLRLVWAEEIERWLPHVRPGDVTVIEGKDDRWGWGGGCLLWNTDVYTTQRGAGCVWLGGRGGAWGMVHIMRDIPWQVVI